MQLKIKEDASLVRIEINYKDMYEQIHVNPILDCNGYLHHTIKKGKNNEENIQAGIFAESFSEEENQELRTFSIIRKDGQTIYMNKNIHRQIGKTVSKEAIIQKGNLMKEIDPDMFNKIQTLRKNFISGDVSLLDNLICVCLTSYDKDEIKALLGIDKINFKFQNNTDNVIDGYFGIDSNDFKGLEAPKQLIKE